MKSDAMLILVIFLAVLFFKGEPDLQDVIIEWIRR